METIGQATSRIRNIIKAVKSDAFVTDRFLYSLILKYGRAFIHKQENLSQLTKFNSLFTTLPCLELIEVNKVEACCGGIVSDCLIKRTKDKIPDVTEALFGPVFRTVSSIDGSIELFQTSPGTYTSMTKSTSFKYNTRKYYWFLNGYLYFPDLEWDSVMVVGVFEGDVTGVICDTKECVQRQDQVISIPNFMFADIDQLVLKDLGITYNLPPDNSADKQSALR